MARNGKRRSSRSGRRGSRKGLSLPVKIAIAGTVLTGILGGGAWGMHHYTSIEKIDAAFCYPRADQHQSAAFIDSSLVYDTAPVMRDYRTSLAEMYDAAPPNSRLMVFTTAADVQQTKARPVFTVCKPPATSAEQEAIGAPTVSKPMLERRAAEAREAYLVKVDEVIASIQDPENKASDSPILEQVREISRYSGFQGRSRSFAWISDGIQNSEAARFCAKKGHMPRYETFAKHTGFTDLKPEPFAGADIDVLLVEVLKLPQAGLEHCSNNEMRRWWKAYFEDNGADSVTVTPLRHWAGS